MKLLSISFEEFKGQPREWILNEAQFGQINLIVGKNSTGKTRLLNIINGLARLISAEQNGLYESGKYLASFDFSGQNYIYKLDIEKFHVKNESLSIDGKEVLSRDQTGEGKIYAEELQTQLRFQTPTTELAAVYRRDSIQHPFLEELYNWGKTTKHYLFGSEFGRNVLSSKNTLKKESTDISKNIVDPNYVIGIFESALKKHGDKFKDSVLTDFESLGYSCNDVLVTDISEYIAENRLLFGLAVQEKDLDTITPQISMSQGMFRALALVIQLNYNVFEKKPVTILVDDIGEGLDYSRSSNTILLLIEKASKNNFQLLMTTNDRFVMNAVDLKYWSILNRSGSSVTVYNEENSPDEFEDFKFIGLSNFDFFSNDYFLGDNQ